MINNIFWFKILLKPVLTGQVDLVLSDPAATGYLNLSGNYRNYLPLKALSESQV